MLTVQNLTKRFQGRVVLNDVSMSIDAGEIVGLIGRSGAGKSTLARCLTGLETIDHGRMILNGAQITPGQGAARQHLQYLWQDPVQSLSPYLTAHTTVLETLNGFNVGPRQQRAAQARDMLAAFSLPEDMLHRRMHALSGGQCQRVALARALAAQPQVLILDEPLSSLDLPTQISTINVLQKLHADHGTSMLIVSHDLAPLRHLAHRILVLDDAQIVENLPMARFGHDAVSPLARAYAQTLTHDR
ncbi:ATP-binding cassette domain-containing protein [Roseobacter sp.]|uniref:ABC transporter ATP-binding protein n=1 Tax=Roseobacter sp. TaxID=1907202 RepID=UPI003299C622